MPKRNNDGHHRDGWPEGSLEPAQSFIAEFQMGRCRRGWDLRGTTDCERQTAPNKKDHHHDRGDLHDAQSFGARLMQTFDVVPPEIQRHQDRKENSELIRRYAELQVQQLARLVRQTPEVLAGANAADGPCQDVVE